MCGLARGNRSYLGTGSSSLHTVAPVFYQSDEQDCMRRIRARSVGCARTRSMLGRSFYDVLVAEDKAYFRCQSLYHVTLVVKMYVQPLAQDLQPCSG